MSHLGELDRWEATPIRSITRKSSPDSKLYSRYPEAMRRSKIVCTLGPATNTEDKIRALMRAGMNVVRINRSHGTQEDAAHEIELVRKVEQEFEDPVAILVDLQGPKIRLGTFVNGVEELTLGQDFTITTRDVPGDSSIVSTTFAGLPADCHPGDILLIDDGNVQVRVTRVDETDVVTKVEIPGKVSNHKGLNLPGVAVSVPALSEKDEDDLRWALHQDVDYIALSFVRRASDIDDVHRVMDEVGRRLPVIAKIEKPQAVQNLKEIIKAFDAIMVARGDLGVEMPLEEVPNVQKQAIELCRAEAKSVIVATQVLESMIHNAHPTRAEASDCANAVWDGASAVMLSGETAVGAYPVQAVETMARIIEAAEERGTRHFAKFKDVDLDWESIIARHATLIASSTGAKFLVTFTDSGATARRLARLRSTIPIYAFCYHEKTRRQLAMVWGIQSFPITMAERLYPMIYEAEATLMEKGMAEPDQVTVFVGGLPPGHPGHTNSIRIHRVGAKDI